MLTLPLVSCLTVTADRLVLLKEAIACYCRQSYPRRELVIVTAAGERYRQAIRDHLDALGRDDIRLATVDAPDAPLGVLRNVSLDAAHGDLICQWDDDDLYHPERIARQVAAMTADGAGACFLTDHLQFFARGRQLYWIDWRRFTVTREKQLLPGSMVARRDRRFRYPETGNAARWSEDNAIRAQIAGASKVTALEDHGWLYVYRCHGRNYMSDSHHVAITRAAAVDSEFLAAHQTALKSALSSHALPKPFRLCARGETPIVPAFSGDTAAR